MSTKSNPLTDTAIIDRDLVLTRIIDAPREKLYAAWTQPELLKQWFAPLPYTTPHAEMDVRAGGSSLIVMRGPDGVDMPNSGVYLEVIPNEKVVATDAFTKAWVPSEKPFMTLILTFEEVAPGKTKYTAIARHWSMADKEAHEKMGFHQGWGISMADKEAHEKMGFHQGWGICADQLTALVTKK